MEKDYVGTCTDESINIIIYEYIDKVEDYLYENKIKL